MKYEIIIIGAGHSGGMAAITLRQKKFTGSILIIGDENYSPYQKPALSKGFLTNQVSESSLMLRSDSFYEKNNIELMINNKVVAINRVDKLLELNDNSQISYNKLIIATGSKINQINNVTSMKGVYYLRTIKDSLIIKEELDRKKSIGIIGSGYIGLETASIARKKNLDVTVFEMENRIMSRVACKKISKFFQLKHQSQGVNFVLNKSIIDIKDKDNKKRIIGNDSKIFNLDMIIAGTGVQPDISLAIDSGLKCENGITVDEYCLTSDHNIFAIGDCTNHINNFYKTKLRLESVQNAVGQAKAAASYLVGEKKPYKEVPWFWSEQYDLKLQIVGINNNFDERVLKGSLADEKFSMFYLKNKKLISVYSINSPKDFVAGRKIIERGGDASFYLNKN
jgi:3-phenylpropionate/trans-cinnamate dioxygenase ferredoxin reductase component